jgi:hypothetical protein
MAIAASLAGVAGPGLDSEKELLPQEKAVSVVVSVGLGCRCVVLLVRAKP